MSTHIDPEKFAAMVADIQAIDVVRRAKCQERDDARIEADKVCSEWIIAARQAAKLCRCVRGDEVDMTERPRLITQFTDARPFSAAANRWQYRHPTRASLWRSLFWWR